MGAQAAKSLGTCGIVFDYGLDDRDSIPGRGKGFPPGLCVQTYSEAHPASYRIGTGVLSQGQSAARA
jgi:hypothetical protein